ncbi:hypothetical protein IWW55_000875 [Coemansia sp. RSA 2706]|nr:hypothetical protein IWW55_000875 [Coemansia sp. RSA 2706]
MAAGGSADQLATGWGRLRKRPALHSTCTLGRVMQVTPARSRPALLIELRPQ